MGYPIEAAEIAMLSARATVSPLEELRAVTDAAEVRSLIAAVGHVHVSEAVQRYAVALTTATRRSQELRLGASPRATLHLVGAGRAHAAMRGRDYVLPDDLRELAPAVLSHRLLPTVETAMAGRSVGEILGAILSAVPVPDGSGSPAVGR